MYNDKFIILVRINYNIIITILFVITCAYINKLSQPKLKKLISFFIKFNPSITSTLTKVDNLSSL